MIVEEKKFQEEDGTIGYYEGIYDSSNILGTTYFPLKNTLYISFNRGGVYSYSNVTEELYEEFKNAESQGKFFAKEIKSQPQKYVYRKEFTLYPEEVKAMKEVVENSKEEIVDNEFILGGTLETETLMNIQPDNTICFYIEEEEIIKVNDEGFYWKGELVEEDETIYQRFKEWLDTAEHKKKNAPVTEEHEVGLLELAKKVLEYYGNEEIYLPPKYDSGACLTSSRNMTPFIENDKGAQARNTLKMINQLQGEHEKIVEDYQKIMDEELKNIEDKDVLDDIINSIKKAN